MTTPNFTQDQINEMVKKLKTSGKPNDAGFGKDFMIKTPDGDEYYCLKMNASGSKWQVNGEDFKTIKSIKVAIVKGEIGVQTLDEVEAEAGSESHPDLIEPMNHDLDCLDAHTLLALFVEPTFSSGFDIVKEARRTLSNNGYYTEDDTEICWETAQRDLDGFRQRQVLRGHVEVNDEPEVIELDQFADLRDFIMDEQGDVINFRGTTYAVDRDPINTYIAESGIYAVNEVGFNLEEFKNWNVLKEVTDGV